MTSRNYHKQYSLVAKLFGASFFIVGLVVLIFPGLLGECLTWLGHAIGLTGEVGSAPGTLWHALTLSLMATLTALAWYSGRNPEENSLYIAILVAKIVSTAGFLVLAWTNGTVWIFCAVTDTFVAVVFVMLRSKVNKGLIPGFARIENACAPHYDVLYGKIDLDKDKAFWFIYTTINGQRQEASSWGILFDSGKIYSGKITFPLQDLAPSNSIIIPDETQLERFRNRRQAFHLGANHLDTSNALGMAGDISWDLQFTDRNQRHSHVPRLANWLRIAKSKYYACFLDARFSGTIQNGDERISLENKPGMVGHYYGIDQANCWAWAHCNNFDEREDVIFEGISAKIKIAGTVAPPMTSMIMIIGKERYEFSSMIDALLTKSEFGDGKWNFEAKSSKAILMGKASFPETNAIVKYTDTDDSNLWCHNSMISNLRLEFTDRKSNKTEIFESKGTTAFELVDRLKPDRTPDL